MKKISQILGVIWVVLLTLGFSVGILAEESATIAKDETVYINLNSNGSINEVLTVNHIDTPEPGTYVDYGNYSTIENITGREVPTVEGNKITWELPAYENGFYYIGKLQNPELPWTFGITYLLDNQRVNADELAGANGEIKIRISASPNSKGDEYFKENFALQLSVALNTDKCKDVTAYNATEVLAGKTLTLSYTAMAGGNISDTITFQAEAFEFEGISLILSPFSMDSYGNLGDIEDNVTAMIDAMDALIAGTQKLQGGMRELSNGAGELAGGSQALAQGAKGADESMGRYQQGLNTFSSYINSFSAEMTNSLAALENAGKNLEAAKAALNKSSGKVKEAIANIDSTAQGYAANIAELEAALNGLSTGLAGISSGMESIIAANSGIGDNLKEIQGQYTALAQKYKSLAQGLAGGNGTDLANAVLASETDSENAKELAQAYLSLAASTSAAKGSLDQLNAGFDQLNSTFSSSINSISQGYSDINASIKDLQKGVNSIIRSLGSGFDFTAIKTQLISLQNELNSAAGVLGGFEVSDFDIDVNKYKAGMEQMTEAANGLKENFELLHQGISQGLISGIEDLNNGINILYGNLKTLPDSANSLLGGERAMKNGINHALDQFVGNGETSPPRSFAAPDENISPRTIQFIGTTPAIADDNVVYEAPPEEEANLWQKIKNLFN